MFEIEKAAEIDLAIRGRVLATGSELENHIGTDFLLGKFANEASVLRPFVTESLTFINDFFET